MNIPGLKGTEDLNAPIASQSSNSIAKITLLGIPLIPVVYIALVFLANKLLPAPDAERAKGMIDTFFPYLAAAVGGGGPLALFGRSLLLTQAKIKVQTPAPMPETVNAGGDVNLSQVAAAVPFLEDVTDTLDDWRDLDGDGIQDDELPTTGGVV